MNLEFKLSTIKENIPLLSEELLAEINAVVARHGHDIIKKKALPQNMQLVWQRVRADSGKRGAIT